MILKDTATFQALFTASLILCLEHHYCGDQLWRSLTFKKSPVKNIKRSPYCRLALVPPNFMKFGIRGQLTDVITCFKFLVDRFSGYEFLTPQNCHFPLTCCVALTTVWQCCATLSLKSVKSLCLLPVVLVLVLLVWSWR